MLTLAVMEEEIEHNPVARVRKPPIRPTREHTPIPVATIERIRAGLPLRDQTLISVLAYAGLRPTSAGAPSA